MIRDHLKLHLLALICTIYTLFPLLSATAEEVKLEYAGRTLNANFVLADGKGLSDGAILITHGTLAHNRMELIATLQTAIAERGLNTLAINLSLGLDDRYGMYDCSVPHRHLGRNAAKEIARWVDWLKGKGVADITVMGHSRGGNQTARYAAQELDPAVKQVVLLAPTTWDAGKVTAKFKKRHNAPLADVLARAEAMAAAGRGQELMAGVGVLYCPGTDVTAQTFLDYYRPDPAHDAPSIVGEIKVPVLVIAASQDRVVTDLPEKMTGRVGGNVGFIVIEDAGHFFLNFFAEDVADAIAKFVGGRGF